jgi:peptidyl-tRNA hydrolase, PTH1 family
MDLAAVVGLGNPGTEYAATRHNLGFRLLDALARRWRADDWQHRYRCLVARRSGARPLLLAKPQTFMNCSGDAVAALCRGEDLTAAQCLVLVDDVELRLGQLRLRASGGSGAHNGLRSVVAAIGEGFPRLRMGIGPAEPYGDLADWVLSAFETAEVAVVEEMAARAIACIEMALAVGIPRAASRFNAREEPADDAEGPPS